MCNCETCSFDTKEKEIFYEIHITVENADVDKFKNFCNKKGLKPVLLDLQKEGLFDLMTSYKFSVSQLSMVFAEVAAQIFSLNAAGFKCIRSKVETVPWNPEIKNYPNGYYETHLVIKTPDVMLPALREIAKIGGAHVSKNVFKKVDDIPTYMVTYRTKSNYIKIHENYVNTLKAAFGEFEIVKEITEYCIFDSNLKHDDEWVKQ